MAIRLQTRYPRYQPTLDEWLDGLSRLTPVSLSTPAAEAVRQAREAEDAALADVLDRPPTS